LYDINEHKQKKLIANSEKKKRKKRHSACAGLIIYCQLSFVNWICARD